MVRASGNIAWVPCNPDLTQNRLFVISSVRDNAIERFVEAERLLSMNGFTSNTIDLCNANNVDVLIFYNITSELRWVIRAIKNNPQIRLINIPIEPPVVSPLHDERFLSFMPFDSVLVWNDNLAMRGRPFLKANIGEAVIDPHAIAPIPYESKKFLVAIYSNKMIKHNHGLYEERNKAFEFFSRKPEGLDLYGMGWSNSNKRFIAASYRGTCKSKLEVLKNYRFSICFENAKGYPGLVTEKIFDCFAAGTVPIYYGAPNVQDYIPKECFIDFRDFSCYEELYQYLAVMPAATYQSYLDAVHRFVQTPIYHAFTSERFAEIIVDEVQALLRGPPSYRSVAAFKLSLLRNILHNFGFFLRNINRCRRFLFDLVTVW